MQKANEWLSIITSFSSPSFDDNSLGGKIKAIHPSVGPLSLVKIHGKRHFLETYLQIKMPNSTRGSKLEVLYLKVPSTLGLGVHDK